MTALKTLIFDIETSPIISYTWGLYDQNVGLNQIKSDWHMLAWAAKWLGEPASRTMYLDNRNKANVENDRDLVQSLVNLINEADVTVTQNGDAFDFKKLRARAVVHGLPPIKPVKSIDILKEKRKIFGFTSNKLEYTTKTVNKKYKKLDHRDYPGFELWKAVLSGDKKAWQSMEKYTKHDVLSTEEEYTILAPYFPNHPMLHGLAHCRVCGSADFTKVKERLTAVGMKTQYQCKSCGHYTTGKLVK